MNWINRMTEGDGRLEVVRHEVRDGRSMALCRCICGIERWIRSDRIPKFFLRVCGCDRRQPLEKLRWCNACEKRHRIDKFYLDPAGRPRSSKCKDFINKQSRSWHKANIERSRKYSRDNMKIHHARERFGLERDEYERLLKQFGPKCNICKNPETRRGRKSLSLDHCHASKLIRGALCSRCNTMIGFSGDNPGIMEKAASYLKNPPGAALGIVAKPRAGGGES
jgi:hypothetical protein